MNPTLAFLLVAGALVGAALAFVLPPLLRAGGRARVSRTGLNAEICRQQIAEIERDRELGLVGAYEAERARDELKRRLLAEVQPELPSSSAPRRGVAFVVAAAVPVCAALLYLAFGNPRALDRSPSMGTALPSTTSVSDLAAHLRDHPDDARAWVMLARGKMDGNDFADAADAFGRAVAASQKVARDPGVLCEFADALAMEQGSLRGRPTDLVLQALALDEQHPQALEMAGSAAFERGRYREAVVHWQRLLALIPAGTERHAELSGAIERARRLPDAS